MAFTKSFVAVAFLSSITLASPAFAQAQHRGGGHDGGGNRGGGGGGHVERSAPQQSRPAPQQQSRGPERTYSGPRTYNGGGPSRSYEGRSYSAPRYSAPARTPYVAPRVYSRGYSVSPRVYSSPRVYNNYNGRYNGRYYGGRYYAPRVYSHVIGPVYRSYGYRYYGYPSYVYRPYYFRPHFSIGFGFFAGYAVPYSYSYPDYYPVPYPVPYGVPYSTQPYGDYGYPNQGYPQEYQQPYQQGSVQVQPGVQPGPTNAGGVTFEVNPPDAQIFVDGNYYGVAEDFDGTKQPLTLQLGQHRVELRRQGYQVVTFDVNVIAGQVIPYRGDMPRNDEEEQ